MREQLLERSGVYLIRNTMNGKVYVGSAIQFTKRWWDHRNNLERGTSACTYLQHAWNAYGADAFQWIIFELCPANERIGREQYWMDWFQSYDSLRGYNIRHIAESNAGLTQSAQSIEQRRTKMIGRINSPEHRARISAGKMGHEVSAEQRAKNSATIAQKYAAGWRPSFVPPPRVIASDCVAHVRALLSEGGHTLRAIGQLTGINHSTVYRIKAGKPPYDHDSTRNEATPSGATGDTVAGEAL